MNSNSHFPRLLGDIGGTNARLAWQDSRHAPLSDIATYPCADHESLLHAMQHYLQVHAKPAPHWCAIGIANPIVGDHVQMTNHDWSFSITAVQQALGLERFLVINDFTALALSLPALSLSDLLKVGGGEPARDAPLALLGPGTGLGVSGLLPANRLHASVPLNGEGGHVTLAGTNDLEDAVIRCLRRRFGHASAERVLSGPGLFNLYEALCEVAGVPAQPHTAAEITAAAQAGSDAQCAQAEALFFSFLGTMAGNLTLSLGARGGVYIGGGIVPRLGARILASSFRERFESKGRFRAYLASIPVFVVHADVSPALIGASRALDDL
ncbi:MAG: glucokinase [Cytophagales bacterium]|nr:glucokinase [Rhizobacter sp.]